VTESAEIEPAAEEREGREQADETAGGRGFRGAPVTAALFAANIGIFAAQVALAGDLRFALGSDDRGRWDYILRWLGANASLWTIADSRFETLVTSVFLHASILHLALNLVLLYQVGRIVERSIGSARFFPLYLAAGIVGSAASAIWGRFFGQAVSVGASGAICGLVGAAIVIGLRTEGVKSELSRVMMVWLGVLLLIGVVKHLRGDVVQVDNAAHVGGALAGMIVSATWERGYAYSARGRAAILAACVALVLASGLVVYVRDRTDPYLFLDVEGRTRVALEALGAHRCDRAHSAIRRAMSMDRKNRALQALDDEIAQECAGAEPPVAPRRRR
jgi:rhomboid protease GluP